MSGISNRLDEVFDCEIYAGEVNQNLQEPCFLITPIAVVMEPQLGNRQNRFHPFDIIYFPKGNSQSEKLSVGESLILELELISLSDGSFLRGTKMHFEIVDDVLHFFVEYNFGAFKIVETDEVKMDDLSVEGGIKYAGS